MLYLVQQLRIQLPIKRSWVRLPGQKSVIEVLWVPKETLIIIQSLEDGDLIPCPGEHVYLSILRLIFTQSCRIMREQRVQLSLCIQLCISPTWTCKTCVVFFLIIIILCFRLWMGPNTGAAYSHRQTVYILRSMAQLYSDERELCALSPSLSHSAS